LGGWPLPLLVKSFSFLSASGSLLSQELHPVPRIPLGNPLSNQTILQTQTTKVVTLNPSKNILPMENHTKSIDLEHLKNTQHSLATQHQKYSRFRKHYT